MQCLHLFEIDFKPSVDVTLLNIFLRFINYSPVNQRKTVPAESKLSN